MAGFTAKFNIEFFLEWCMWKQKRRPGNLWCSFPFFLLLPATFKQLMFLFTYSPIIRDQLKTPVSPCAGTKQGQETLIPDVLPPMGRSPGAVPGRPPHLPQTGPMSCPSPSLPAAGKESAALKQSMSAPRHAPWQDKSSSSQYFKKACCKMRFQTAFLGSKVLALCAYHAQEQRYDFKKILWLPTKPCWVTFVSGHCSKVFNSQAV